MCKAYSGVRLGLSSGGGARAAATAATAATACPALVGHYHGHRWTDMRRTPPGTHQSNRWTDQSNRWRRYSRGDGGHGCHGLPTTYWLLIIDSGLVISGEVSRGEQMSHLGPTQSRISPSMLEYTKMRTTNIDGLICKAHSSVWT